MTRIESVVTIDRAPEDVFDYVTTPANWPQWHPSSVRVEGDAGHPHDVGERCTEEFVVAGRRGTTGWVVTRRERPRLWAIATDSPSARAAITYELTPAGDGGTIFRRTLEYAMPNPLLEVLNALVLRRRVERESATAVRNLRDVLQSARTASV